MKNWIYSLLFSLAFTIPAMAQKKNDKIESIRAAFITQKLDLTPEESQKFWPIYNSYREEFKQLAVKRNQLRKAAFKDQSNAAPVDDLKIDSEILSLKRRYRQEFSKVLPRTKAALVYPAEREFTQQLIRHLPKRNQKN